jgi:hypothetical protein
MSFSFSAKGTKADVRQQVEALAGGVAHGQVPLALRIYLLDNLAAFADDAIVEISCCGHQRGAWPGDTNAGSATVMVKTAD